MYSQVFVRVRNSVLTRVPYLKYLVNSTFLMQPLFLWELVVSDWVPPKNSTEYIAGQTFITSRNLTKTRETHMISLQPPYIHKIILTTVPSHRVPEQVCESLVVLSNILLFSPLLGEMIQFDEHIFQMGIFER